MAKRRTASRFEPPFLREIEALYNRMPDLGTYPFSIPAIKSGNFNINFNKPITIIVGDNGIGKSSILEAIAANCGFSLIGGTQNHALHNTESETLSQYLRMSWLPKINKGFFLRAETFFSFIQSIDVLAEESGKDIYEGYGGKSLRQRSHGESFLALFESRFGSQGIYILDEPEAALSPQRQIEFLKMLRVMEKSNRCQIIISTHSVLLMAYPGAQLLKMTDQGVEPIEFHDMPHFRIMREFCLNPDGFMAGVMMEADEEEL